MKGVKRWMGFARIRCRQFFDPPPEPAVPNEGADAPEETIGRWKRHEWMEIGILTAVLLLLGFLIGGEFLKALEKVQAARERVDSKRRIANTKWWEHPDFLLQEATAVSPSKPPSPAAVSVPARKSASGIADLLRRARGGDKSAQIEMGDRYQAGRDVPKDPGLAVHWFALAAGQGDPYAALQLGACYDDGLGIPRNDRKAYEWYQKAVQLSADLIQKESGPPPPALRTVHAIACQNVGACLYRGEGVAKNEKAAVGYLEKAAVEFFPARNFLGEMAKKGDRGAAEALERAVQAGNELSAVQTLLMTP